MVSFASSIFLQALIDVRFVFPTVNNIGFGLYLLPNILNNNIKNFENYRRNYPIRYEWHHFNSSLPLL
jgi:hypothetical protein